MRNGVYRVLIRRVPKEEFSCWPAVLISPVGVVGVSQSGESILSLSLPIYSQLIPS